MEPGFSQKTCRRSIPVSFFCWWSEIVKDLTIILGPDDILNKK
jgi:hypothetical protein